ncbi:MULTISPECIES: alpha/beta fold hydrolase [unclassified Mesorhizobium]|uniref:alpha/beta hydrolase n=1 Tax=unclassified Mesorhizobium TaxID=325217 RepID=UPI00112CCD05|nr:MULTISPECIES: alpha/beta fold hydrolase [unclassified Mesorhizobium]TPL21740.1 alpha/beta fold hydrolase [Mesorhizobium sp. B2-4-10]TPM23045.1 alpha/beta fold hydrolase [Mesorhizobium sp. B2-3-6]
MQNPAGRLVLVISLALLVQSCAGPRAVTGLASPVQISNEMSAISFLIATTRTRSPISEPPYSRDRSPILSFSQLTVVVPATHRPGTVETSSTSPDPKRHFSARDLVRFENRASFAGRLNGMLAKRPPSEREVFIFVHGYNNNFAEGLFRNAQVVHDYRISSVPVHFSWASAGSIGAYLFDRDSALQARDGLAETIEIAARSNASGVFIVGHSMGAYVVMEALRTLVLQGKAAVTSRIRGVLLAAPDIDPDVFSSQVRDIPQLPHPFTIVVSRRDRALSLSRRIAGGQPRVGSGFDIPLLQKKDIQVIDISDVDGGGHSGFATSETLMKLLRSGPLLRRLIVNEDMPVEDKAEETRQIIFDNASLVLHLPLTILKRSASRQSVSQQPASEIGAM